jgi:hypothetical protein
MVATTMDNPTIPTKAQQIAQAASAFEQRRTGHAPKSVVDFSVLMPLVEEVAGGAYLADQAPMSVA